MAKIFWRIALVFVFVLIIAACSGGTNYVGITAVPETVTTFTVKFDTAGGSDVDSQVVEKGRFASEPEPPVKDGFKFSGGWYTDSEFTNIFSFTSAITKDTTLWARWISEATLSCMVKFESEGGSDVSSQVVEIGQTVSEPKYPTRKGYIFDDWYSDKALLTKFDFSSAITEDTTLWAKWIEEKIPPYTVKFDSNGGTPVARQVVEVGNTAVEPENPVKCGVSFGGWYADAELTDRFDFSVPLTKSLILCAKWICNVTFDSVGGSFVPSQTITEGEKAVVPPPPSRNGFLFIGWYLDRNFNTKFDFSASVTADTTVYARWLNFQGFVSVDGGTVGEVAGSYVFKNDSTTEIANLYACEHEVTQKEYEKYCIYANSGPSDLMGKGENFPAYKINWYDALVYCNLRSIADGLDPCYTINGTVNPADWPEIVSSAGKYCGPLPAVTNERNTIWDAAVFDITKNGYRLPTRAEWEYLARGGKNGVLGVQTAYAGSDDIDEVAWYKENSSGKVHEIKGKKPNALNLYDMSGNLMEWCWDVHETDSGYFRVLLGGSWGYDASRVISKLTSGRPTDRFSQNGFRVVRTR